MDVNNHIHHPSKLYYEIEAVFDGINTIRGYGFVLRTTCYCRQRNSLWVFCWILPFCIILMDLDPYLMLVSTDVCMLRLSLGYGNCISKDKTHNLFQCQLMPCDGVWHLHDDFLSRWPFIFIDCFHNLKKCVPKTNAGKNMSSNS